jgi:hypothetical protein
MLSRESGPSIAFRKNIERRGPRPFGERRLKSSPRDRLLVRGNAALALLLDLGLLRLKAENVATRRQHVGPPQVWIVVAVEVMTDSICGVLPQPVVANITRVTRSIVDRQHPLPPSSHRTNPSFFRPVAPFVGS